MHIACILIFYILEISFMVFLGIFGRAKNLSSEFPSHTSAPETVIKTSVTFETKRYGDDTICITYRKHT